MEIFSWHDDARDIGMIEKIQAAFYILSGLWVIFSLRTFEKVTGPKADKWLVKTIGWLFIVIGLQLWTADTGDVVVLGLGTALVIGGSDVYYSLKGRISKTYLLDAAVQLIFIIGWLLYLLW